MWCGKTDNRPQEDLAKFGHRPDMKVENFKNLFTFWLRLAETHCKNLAILNFFLFEILTNLGPLFHKNPLNVLKSYFTRLKKIQNFARPP